MKILEIPGLNPVTTSVANITKQLWRKGISMHKKTFANSYENNLVSEVLL